MRSQLATALALVTGCDVALGLDEPFRCGADDDDCDGLRDAIDPCPADPSSGDGDSDGDGVGNACDPNPLVAGDVLLSFDGFTELDARWVIAGSTPWEIRGGAFDQPEIADGTVQRAVEPNVQPTVEVVLDVVFGGEGASVGVYVDSTHDIPLECRVVHHAAGDDLVMLLPTLSHVIDTAPLLPGDRGDGLRIYGGQLPDGTIRCRARYGDSDALHVDWKGVLPPRDTFDTLGFRTIQAAAAYRAVAVFSVP